MKRLIAFAAGLALVWCTQAVAQLSGTVTVQHVASVSPSSSSSGLSGVVVVQHTASIANTGSSYADVYARCASGYVALSGGVDNNYASDIEVTTTAPTFNGATQTILYSIANGTQAAPTGWYASVKNFNSVARAVTVSVICAPISGISTIVTSFTASAGTSGSPSPTGTSVSCPSGTVATGGGIDVAYHGSMKVSSSAPRVGSGAGYVYDQAAGTTTAPTGWWVYLRNESSAGTVKAAAICAPVSGIVTVISSAFSLPAGGVGSPSTIGCPSNHIAVGGGIDPNNVIVNVEAISTPVYPGGAFPADRADGSYAAATGWYGNMYNYGSSAQGFRAAVICAPAASSSSTYTDIFARCPTNYVALSGGVDNNDWNDIEITTIAPTFNGATETLLYFVANGTAAAPTGWYASVKNYGSSAHPVTVSAVCAPISGVSTIVTSFTVSAGSSSSPTSNGISASCPSGSIATGGGVDVQDPNAIKVSSSSPRVGAGSGYLYDQAAGTMGAPSGWWGFVRNESTSSGLVKVAAICAPLSNVVTVVSASFAVPASSTGIAASQSVGCPANTIAVGGGIDPDNVVANVEVISTPVYTGGAFPADRADGSYPAPAGWYGNMWNYASTAHSFRTAAICAQVTAPVVTVTVYEFYNTDLRHYFRTAVAAEAAVIDAGGAGPGWVRTGDNFAAYAVGSGPGNDVCRFYYRGFGAANTHFYTANADECQSLRNANPTNNPDLNWRFEELSFRIQLPAGGACPSGTIAVYRAYNNRGYPVATDPNHRFTTSMANIVALQAQGWIFEGIGFCAPT